MIVIGIIAIYMFIGLALFGIAQGVYLSHKKNGTLAECNADMDDPNVSIMFETYYGTLIGIGVMMLLWPLAIVTTVVKSKK